MLFQLVEDALRRHSFSAVPDGGRTLGEVHVGRSSAQGSKTLTSSMVHSCQHSQNLRGSMSRLVSLVVIVVARLNTSPVIAALVQ